MLQNAYFLAKIGADTAENEQHFTEILPTDALWRLAAALRYFRCLGRGDTSEAVLRLERTPGRTWAADGILESAVDLVAKKDAG